MGRCAAFIQQKTMFLLNISINRHNIQTDNTILTGTASISGYPIKSPRTSFAKCRPNDRALDSDGLGFLKMAPGLSTSQGYNIHKIIDRKGKLVIFIDKKKGAACDGDAQLGALGEN
jgi:hypothetical protein